MPRIKPVNPNTADPATAGLLNSVRKSMGAVPKLIAVVPDRGVVADEDLDELRRAGYTDGEVGEIVASVALNLFTNSFNHVAATELDFPAAPELAA